MTKARRTPPYTAPHKKRFLCASLHTISFFVGGEGIAGIAGYFVFCCPVFYGLNGRFTLGIALVWCGYVWVW